MITKFIGKYVISIFVSKVMSHIFSKTMKMAKRSVNKRMPRKYKIIYK